MNFTPARANEIQCDLDTPEAEQRFGKMLVWCCETLPDLFDKVRWTVDSSISGHQHATVTLLHSLPPCERVLLACLLGSDLDREACNYARIKNGSPHPILFLHKGERKTR